MATKYTNYTNHERRAELLKTLPLIKERIGKEVRQAGSIDLSQGYWLDSNKIGIVINSNGCEIGQAIIEYSDRAIISIYVGGSAP